MYFVGGRCSPSVINHSCRPNAVAVFSGTTLQIRCVSAISHREPVRLSLIFLKLTSRLTAPSICSDVSLPLIGVLLWL